MDDLKLYGKNEREIESLVQSVRIYSEDIAVEFGVQKCAFIKTLRGEKLPILTVLSYLRREGKFPH